MEIDELIQQLEGLEWTKQEATLYVTLLQFGMQPASVVARHLKKNRITVYHALERLVQKKIIESSLSKNGVYYNAKAPHLLLQQFTEQKKKMMHHFDNDIESLHWLAPFLDGLKLIDPIRPRVQLFHDDALRQIYKLSLEAKSMVAYFQPWPKDKESPLNEIDDWHTQERIRLKIPIKIIIPKTKEGLAFAAIKKELKETVVVSANLFPLQDVSIVAGSRILIFSSQEKLGISIESRHLANNQRAIFNLAWEGAKALIKNKK